MSRLRVTIVKPLRTDQAKPIPRFKYTTRQSVYGPVIGCDDHSEGCAIDTLRLEAREHLTQIVGTFYKIQSRDLRDGYQDFNLLKSRSLISGQPVMSGKQCIPTSSQGFIGPLKFSWACRIPLRLTCGLLAVLRWSSS